MTVRLKNVTVATPPVGSSTLFKTQRALSQERSSLGISIQREFGIVSKMSTLKFSRKPPLAKSPVRTRPRLVLRSTTSVSVQTPPGSLTKSAVRLRHRDAEESDFVRPEIGSVSFELRALARMARGNIEGEDETTGLGSFLVGVNKSPLFERGRFYDVYSAKRKERLKRKLGMEMEDEGFKKCGKEYHLGAKRQSERLESGRKSIAVDFLVDRRQTQNSRYSLRSSTKENKKPPLSTSFDKSYGVNAGGMPRRVARKI